LQIRIGVLPERDEPVKILTLWSDADVDGEAVVPAFSFGLSHLFE
jgi:hypothetical protein